MKKNPLFLGLAAFTAVLATAAAAYASVPETIHYQGKVTVDSEPFDGTVQFKFAIVDDGTEHVRTATAMANVTDGFVTSIDVVDPGSGYIDPPRVTIEDRGEGAGAEAEATVEDGRVIEITVISPGSGYEQPGVDIEPSPPATMQTFWSNDGTSEGGGAPDGAVSLPVDRGVFSVVFGGAGMDPVSAAVFEASPVFLRVWFDDGNGFEQLTPDQPFTGVPYALRAETAASVANVGIDDEGNIEVAGTIGTPEGEPLQLYVANDPALRIHPLPDELPFGLTDAGPNIVGGWEGNHIDESAGIVVGATIGGGGGMTGVTDYTNIVSAILGTIGGGGGNAVSGRAATIAGGALNEAGGTESTVSGGRENTAGGTHATVSGGRDNTASGSGATVSGGWDNTAYGVRATVGGGQDNAAGQWYSTVPGGRNNEATGDSSFAAGRSAKARHNGAFVWADSGAISFSSSGPDQFLVQAAGGVGVNTNNPERGLHIKQRSTDNSEIGLQIERSGNTNNWAFYVATSDNLGFRYNDQLMSRINASNGEFVALSDERMKDSIEPLQNVLNAVLQLTPSSYFMTHEASRERRSIGLVAQQVKEHFPSAVSKQEEVYGVSYSQISAINTAALIELHDKLQEEKDALLAEIDELRAQVAELTKAAEINDDLENRLVRIEAFIEGELVAGN